MEAFQFASIFTERRKAMGVTQEDIATFVGISRAAVSKWEKGLSYPDITLLPKLAMYFDLSIDALLGYEPQLTKERIAMIYGELAERFANEPYEVVEQEVERLTFEYYSCYPFLVKISELLLNYYARSTEPEKTAAIITSLCERIKSNCTELSILQEATSVEATLNLIQQRPEEVLQMLGSEPTIDFYNESLISSALVMLGQPEKAKQVLQVNAYQKVVMLSGSMSECLMLEIGNEAYLDETVYRLEQLNDIFHLEKSNFNTVLLTYLRAAIAYASSGLPEKAKTMLEKYFQVCLRLEFPLQLNNGDPFFYLLKDWMNQQQSFITSVPRDEQSIKMDILQTVQQHPLLAPLLEEESLSMLFKNVKHYLEGGNKHGKY